MRDHPPFPTVILAFERHAGAVWPFPPSLVKPASPQVPERMSFSTPLTHTVPIARKGSLFAYALPEDHPRRLTRYHPRGKIFHSSPSCPISQDDPPYRSGCQKGQEGRHASERKQIMVTPATLFPFCPPTYPSSTPLTPHPPRTFILPLYYHQRKQEARPFLYKKKTRWRGGSEDDSRRTSAGEAFENGA